MSNHTLQIAEDSARGGFFLVAGSIVSTIISAIASIFVARVLGPELYGQYTLALVVPQILFLLADLGINEGLIRFSASLRAQGEHGRIRQLIKRGILLKALVGTAIFCASFAFAESLSTILLNRADIGQYIRIGSFSIVFQIVLSTATSAFIGLDKAEYNALATNVYALAKAMISVALVWLGLSVAGAVIGFVLGYVVAAIAAICLLLFYINRYLITESSSSLAQDLKTLVSYSLPLYMSALLSGFIPSYQSIILAIFTSDVDIGNLKAAANFYTLITLVSAPIAAALLPAFSKLASSTSETRENFFKFANKYTALLIVPIATLMIIFSNQIVLIIYGSTYTSAALFLAIHCLIYYLVGIGYLVLSSLFNGLGQTRTTLKMSLITVLIFVIGTPLMTRTYGVPGAIATFLTSTTVGTAYGAYVATANHKIRFPKGPLMKIYAVSIVSGIPSILILRFTAVSSFLALAFGGALYMFTYITLIPVARAISSTELDMIARILQRIVILKNVMKPFIGYEKMIMGKSAKLGPLTKEKGH